MKQTLFAIKQTTPTVEHLSHVFTLKNQAWEKLESIRNEFANRRKVNGGFKFEIEQLLDEVIVKNDMTEARFKIITFEVEV